MPLVEKDTVDDAFNGLVNRGIRKHYVRCFATEFERVFLARAGQRALDDAPDIGRPGKRYFVHTRVVHDGGASLACTGYDIYDARRQTGIRNYFGQFERRQRRGLGRLEHHCVTRCQRRRNFPGRHEQRKIPRNYLSGHTQRLRSLPRERIVELVGPACVVEKMCGSERHVDVARFTDRLAAVE